MATLHKLPTAKGKAGAPRKRGLGQLADIAIGASGPEVEDLQRALGLAGYYVEVTGTFDAATQTAVVAAQKDAGLPTTGIVDDATQNAILDRSEGSSAPSKNGQVIRGDPIDITGRVPPPEKFFLFDPNVALWKKALAVGGGLAVLGVLYELLTKERHATTAGLVGYEKALNAAPKCRGNRPPSVDLTDAEILEAEG